MPREYELVRTVNVKELNPGNGFVFEIKTKFGDINAFQIDVVANRRGAKAGHYRIVAKADRTAVLRKQ